MTVMNILSATSADYIDIARIESVYQQRKPSPQTLTVTYSARATSVDDHFAAIRTYARKNQQTVLDLIAEHLLDDLPVSIAQTIRDYLEARKPKVKPGEVEYRSFFSSEQTDISERVEEIIYGSARDNDA